MNTLQNSLSTVNQYKSIEAASTQKPVTGADSLSSPQSVSKVSISSLVNQTVQQPVVVNSASKTKAPSSEDAQKLMDTLNRKLGQINDYMTIKKDTVSGHNVYSFMDSNTHKVIKQYPSEDFLNMARRLTEYIDKVQASKPLSQSAGASASSSSNASTLGNIISELA